MTKKEHSMGGFTLIIFFLALALIFMFTVSPSLITQKFANWNLLVVGSLASIVATFTLLPKKSELSKYFSSPSLEHATNYLSIGFIFGGIMIFTISFILRGITSIYTLLGSVNAADLAGAKFEDSIFFVLLQPVTETIIITTLLLITIYVLRNRVPYPKIWAIGLVILFFGAMHFASQGSGAYEYSSTGFINFLTDAKNLGLPNYTGALPMLLMGAFFATLILAYSDWLVGVGMHIVNNFAVLLISGTQDPTVISFLVAVGLFMGVIFIFAIYSDQLKELGEFSVRNVVV